MRVEMQRQVRFLPERREKRFCRRRFQQARHVLDGDHVCAGLFQFLQQADVIGEIVFRSGTVVEVARVADRALADLAALDHRIHRDAHVLDPVETIENSEHIDARFCGLLDEMAHHIVGIVGVADPVRAAQQHLGEQVGRFLSHQRQPLPRVFGEETHGHVKGRPAPAFEAEQPSHRLAISLGDSGDVVAAHSRRQQRLVRVAHGRVGDQHTLFRAHPFGEASGSQFFEFLAGARFDAPLETRRHRLGHIGGRLRAAPAFGMTVHRDIGDIVEQLGCPVLPPDRGEKLRRVVDELGGVAVVAELRVADDRFKEGQIGRHTTNAELAQSPIHSRDSLYRRRRPGRHLFKQRIVETGDDRA